MKHQFLALLLAASALPALAADVGVSVSVGQPGFYGRIDIGNVPPPVLIYPQPVVIQQGLCSSATSTALLACTSRPRKEVEQTLPQVRRVQPSGLFRQGRLVQQRLRAALPKSTSFIERQRQGQGKGQLAASAATVI